MDLIIENFQLTRGLAPILNSLRVLNEVEFKQINCFLIVLVAGC